MSLKDNKFYSGLLKLEHTKFFFPIMLVSLVVLSAFGVFKIDNLKNYPKANTNKAQQVVKKSTPKPTPVVPKPTPVVPKPTPVASNPPKTNPTPSQPIIPNNSVIPSPSNGVHNLIPAPSSAGQGGSSGGSSSSDTSSGSSGSASNTGSKTSSGTTSSTYHAAVSYFSSNWSGYVKTGANFTEVYGSWTVPNYSFTSGPISADAAWIGIGGVTSNDLIQIGTVNNVDSNDQKDSYAFLELLPSYATAIPELDVSVGDHISASIIQTGTSLWQVNISDTTKSQSYVTTVSYSSSLSSAEWIEEDPSKNNVLVPLSNFGTINFSNCSATLGGSKLSIAQLGSNSIFLVNQNSTQTYATPSDVTNGGEFSVTHN